MIKHDVQMGAFIVWGRQQRVASLWRAEMPKLKMICTKTTQIPTMMLAKAVVASAAMVRDGRDNGAVM